MESKMIRFKGMPLFQRARFKGSFVGQGALENMACFFYMVQGKMMSFDTRGVHQISEKEAMMKQCGNYIQKYEAPSDKELCEAIAVYMHPELLKEIYKDEIPSFLREDKNPMPKKFISDQLIEQYMMNLSIYFEDPEAFDEELGVLKLKELVMILLKTKGYKDIQQMLTEMFSPVNVKFKSAIQKNLFNNLSLEELAFICNMSLSTFKREFKKVFDTTPAKYIKQRRLEHAASLLLSSDDAIGDIAYSCGFQDVTTFSASFADRYGTSPSKYRLN
jgi:AraC-like DNA-binding protein